MRKVINGKMYDTETAKKRSVVCSNCGVNDFGYWEETLYQKKTGEYFLYGEGGPASKYARACGQNEWSGGSEIVPLTIEAAKKWAEALDGDSYEAIFGNVEE